MPIVHEAAVWRCHIQVAKYWGELTPEKTPYAIDDYDGNMLVYGGVSAIWEFLMGGGTTTAGQALTFFNAAQSAIGVGDGTGASVATQNDLLGTNKLRRGLNAGYPEHTDGTASANNTIRFRSTFDTTQANFAWEEAGVFNSATAATGRMLNRKVQSMGTKTNTSSWQITFDVSITSV